MSIALARLTGWLLRHVPAIESARNYSRAAFGGDLMAGLTVATVAVPQAMAYASLAGVPPEYGLYSAIVVTAVGAVFASSRQLINGPTNAISIALLSALAVIPQADKVEAAILLAVLVGMAQLAIAFLRLGDLTRYVSHSVILGFTVGASTLLVLDQLKNLFGWAARGGPEDHFLRRFWLSLTTGGGIHWPTFLIGAATIAIVLSVRSFNDYCRRRGSRIPIPQHLVAVAALAALVGVFGLDKLGVQIVGTIPAALPTFQVPDWKWDQVRLLTGSAFAIAVLGLLEAVAMAKFISHRTGQALDINQQCLSEGAANLAGGFFQCIPGSGSLTRSAVNHQAGAVTQWSGVVSALAVAMTVLLFAPLAQYIPRSALAGLLMLAAFRMVDWKQLVFHLRCSRLDAGVVIATALAAVLISVEFCIVIGVFLSFVLYVPRAGQVRMVQLTRTADQRVRERQPLESICDRVLIYDLEGELFFGAEPALDKHFAAIDKAATEPARVVILVLKRGRNPDAAFLKLLESLRGRLGRRDIALLLSGVQPDLHKSLKATSLDRQIGETCIFIEQMNNNAALHRAIDWAYGSLGDNWCSYCPRRQGKSEGPPPLEYEI